MVDGAPPAARRVHDRRRLGRQARLRDRRHVRGDDSRAAASTCTLSGTSSFGADNSTLGAVLMQMNTAQASELFGVDGINSVAVAGRRWRRRRRRPGGRRRARVPTAEVVDHATVLDETTHRSSRTRSTSSATSCWGSAASHCSCRSSSSTTRSRIVLGQRTRELALLRTVGADPSSSGVPCSVEALAIGGSPRPAASAAASRVAKGIEALFGLMGVDLVDYPLILAPRTLIAAAVVGIGVTLLAAIGPARRAATVPPIAAPHGWRRNWRRRLAQADDRRCRAVRRRSGGGPSPVSPESDSTTATVVALALGAIGDLPRRHHAQPARGSASSPVCSDGRCASPASPAAWHAATPPATHAGRRRPRRR